MSEVTVDDKHLLSLDGEAQSQVSSDKRLTRTWIERCKQDCILALVLCHEVDICAHHSECFVYNIPVAIIYARESLNTKVRGKKDLDRLVIPFVGEIPDCSPQKLLPSYRF